MSKSYTVTIVGAGYLGLTTASIFANAGIKTYCLDILPEVIETIKSGKPYFFEPNLEPLLKAGLVSGNLIPTLSYQEAIPNSDISLICVNTPGKPNGELSIDYVLAATKSIAQHAKENHVVALKSTVPPGTFREVQKVYENVSNKTYHYASNPEFLSEGYAVFSTLLPERVIIGTDNEFAKSALEAIYKQVDDYANSPACEFFANPENYNIAFRKKFASTKPFSERLFLTSVQSAELIKMTANSFLATKISFANAISNLCDKTGADINQVMEAVGADTRISRDYMYAGLGWGGGCFPKDVRGLIEFANQNSLNLDLLEASEATNYRQTTYTITKLEELLKKESVNLQDSTICILGTSFKPGTSDIRKSPALKLIEELAPKVKKIIATDPKALEETKKYFENSAVTNIEFVENYLEALSSSDAFVLATPWDEYTNHKISELTKQTKLGVFVDPWHKLQP